MKIVDFGFKYCKLLVKCVSLKHEKKKKKKKNQVNKILLLKYLLFPNSLIIEQIIWSREIF